MAEKVEEVFNVNVCQCYERDKELVGAIGYWEITDSTMSAVIFNGSIIDGKVLISENQRTQLLQMGDDKYGLKLSPRGFLRTDRELPKLDLEDERNLPIRVDVKRLTTDQKVEVIRENAGQRNQIARQAIQQRFGGANGLNPFPGDVVFAGGMN